MEKREAYAIGYRFVALYTLVGAAGGVPWIVARSPHSDVVFSLLSILIGALCSGCLWLIANKLQQGSTSVAVRQAMTAIVGFAGALVLLRLLAASLNELIPTTAKTGEVGLFSLGAVIPLIAAAVMLSISERLRRNGLSNDS